MAIRIDPENTDARALFDVATFGGRHVLEIGSGDGRFTWRYASEAECVTALEPAAKPFAAAREQLPGRLRDHVTFHNIAFEDFAAASAPKAFDIVILSWSLC
jgi:2-polyprenyl-3-methyl-5-hydroxy-6-metoxy-1,4-benzoquinol methylase